MAFIANRQHNKNWYWLFLSLIVVIICCCANPLHFYFLNDDFIHVPKALNGTLGHHNSLRHVGDFSLYIDSLLCGRSPIGYHTTNLLLHLANTFLLVFLLQSISRSLQVAFSLETAIFSAALFGIYAFHSEAIFWVIGRSASLSFFFNTLCWLCFYKALQIRLWLLPMCLFFLAGIFTYEAVWVFPFWLLTWYLLLPAQSPARRQAVLLMVIVWGLFILYFPVRLAVTGEWLGSYEANDLQQLQVLPIFQKTFSLFARSFLPPVYGHKWFLAFFAIIVCLLALLCRWLWKNERKNRLLWFFAIAWLISYFPYISLGISTTGYESERYLYFPSLFLCAFLTYAFTLVGKRNTSAFRILFTGLFAYQLFFFVKASLAFKTISHFAKSGIDAVGSIPQNKLLFIKNLPAYSYGFPVFNFGFPEAIAWMVPKREVGTTKVLNTMNFEKQEILTHIQQGIVADTLVFYAK